MMVWQPLPRAPSMARDHAATSAGGADSELPPDAEQDRPGAVPEPRFLRLAGRQRQPSRHPLNHEQPPRPIFSLLAAVLGAALCPLCAQTAPAAPPATQAEAPAPTAHPWAAWIPPSARCWRRCSSSGISCRRSEQAHMLKKARALGHLAPGKAREDPRTHRPLAADDARATRAGARQLTQVPRAVTGAAPAPAPRASSASSRCRRRNASG